VASNSIGVFIKRVFAVAWFEFRDLSLKDVGVSFMA